MEFKDIVNREVVNIENCEDEPIHIPGSIQPHGFLIAVKSADLTIDFCSGNVAEFIGLRYEQLLGKPVSLVLGIDQMQHFGDAINMLSAGTEAPFALTIDSKSFLCSVHASGDKYILEFENTTEKSLSFSNIYRQTKQFTAYMQQCDTLQSLCQSVADETRNVTGYDRVMIYRFDEENNGEVFAESKIDSVEPFLGLHYPNTDIPAQARQLYLTNLLRLIVDINYEPVPVYTIDDSPGKNLDMGRATLRSVSPIHVKYLRNMGVSGTLTISLLHENKLWGLITCHHYSPKYLSDDVRTAAQLQGHFLTSQIRVREMAEEYEVAKKVNSALDILLGKVFSVDDISLNILVQEQELTAIANASAVIVLVDDTIHAFGDVPNNDEIKKLVNWLHAYSPAAGFSTDNLLHFYPDANKWCHQVSGIVFHSLGSGQSDCVIWCRPQALQEINWAGDPHKAIVRDETGISPRNSFALWKEVKECTSFGWQKPELAAAASFASALQKHVHTVFLAREEIKQRTLSEKLKEANAELENLNWIGSHDLKEPLRKIQLFASRILDEEDQNLSKSILQSVKKMNDSAKRMQMLITDILSYSKLNHIEEGLAEVELNGLLDNIVTDLNFEIQEKKATVNYKNLPTIKGVSFLLNQLFINLFRNSLKFSRPDIPPVLTVAASKPAPYNEFGLDAGSYFHKIIVQDNGIGFDNKYSEAVFKVFTRLHSHAEISGSGVGLALCRKIMKTHHGYINVNSEPGVGTTFSLYFPQ